MDGGFLILSASSNNHQEVARILKEHAGTQNLDSVKEYALCQAIRNGSTEVIEAFIDAKEDLDIPIHGKDTPLTFAAQRGRGKIVNALIKAGVNLNVQNEVRRSALSYAVQRDRSKMVEALILAGADTSMLQPEHRNKYKDVISLAQENGAVQNKTFAPPLAKTINMQEAFDASAQRFRKTAQDKKLPLPFTKRRRS